MVRQDRNTEDDFTVIEEVDHHDLFLYKYIGCLFGDFDITKTKPVVERVEWVPIQSRAFERFIKMGGGMGMIFARDKKEGSRSKVYAYAPMLTMFRHIKRQKQEDEKWLCVNEMAMNYVHLMKVNSKTPGIIPISKILEVMSGAIRWVMDIEIYLSTNPKIKTTEDYDNFMMMFKELVKDFCAEFFCLTEAEREQIIFYELDASLLKGSNPDKLKFSRHLLIDIPGIIFLTHQDCGALTRRFENWTIANVAEPPNPSNWVHFWKKKSMVVYNPPHGWYDKCFTCDMGIYTNDRVIRLYKQRKIEEPDRPFEWYPLGEDLLLSHKLYPTDEEPDTEERISAHALILSTANMPAIPQGVVIDDYTGRILTCKRNEETRRTIRVVRVWEENKPYHTPPMSTNDEYGHRVGFSHPLGLESRTTMQRMKKKKLINPFDPDGKAALAAPVVKIFYSTAKMKRMRLSSSDDVYAKSFSGKNYSEFLKPGEQWEMEGAGNYAKSWNIGEHNCGHSIKPIFCKDLGSNLASHLTRLSLTDLYIMAKTACNDQEVLKNLFEVEEAWNKKKKVRPWTDNMCEKFKIQYYDFNAREMTFVIQLANRFCPNVWLKSIIGEFKGLEEYRCKHNGNNSSVFIYLEDKTFKWTCYNTTCRYSDVLTPMQLPTDILEKKCGGTKGKATIGEVLDEFVRGYKEENKIDIESELDNLIRQLLPSMSF